MTGSKFVTIMLAAFCGLASQFQPSAVNAQQYTAYGQVNGIANNTAFPGFSMAPPYSLFSPAGVELRMQTDGNLVIYNQLGDAIWGADGSWENCGGVYNGGVAGAGTCPGNDTISKWGLSFQANGDVAVLYFDGGPYPGTLVWDSGTYANGAWQYSNPGQYLSIQDNGDLVIYDGDLNVLWAASWFSNFNFARAQYSKQICSC